MMTSISFSPTFIKIPSCLNVLFTAITQKPIVSGNSPKCSPSLSSLQSACVGNAEKGGWDDSMKMNFIENNDDIEAMNGLQISCTREFIGLENQLSLMEAKEACASTRIEYGGISETAMALYDHVDNDRNEENKETGKSHNHSYHLYQ